MLLLILIPSTFLLKNIAQWGSVIKHIIIKTIQALSIFIIILTAGHAEALEYLRILKDVDVRYWIGDLAGQGIATDGDQLLYIYG